MNERRFVAERAQRWRELEALLDRVQREGLARIPGGDVRRLGALYRTAASDLAAARTLGCSDDTVRHVNRLCAAAHNLVYSSRRRGPAGALAAVLRDEFPAVVRRTLRWHLAAAAILAVATVAAYVVLRDDPDLVDRTFGPVFRQRAERAAATPDDTRRYLEVRAAVSPFLSWGIILNNVTVSLSLFALGAATVALGGLSLAVNGVMLGAGLAAFAQAGVPGVILGFIAAHGPLELSAICLASGGGMRVGAAWMMPGRRTRVAAFQHAGREALTLLAGSTTMLLAAGLIEGFVSPSGLPAAVKAAVGAGTMGAFVLWVSRRGGTDDA